MGGGHQNEGKYLFWRGALLAPAGLASLYVFQTPTRGTPNLARRSWNPGRDETLKAPRVLAAPLNMESRSGRTSQSPARFGCPKTNGIPAGVHFSKPRAIWLPLNKWNSGLFALLRVPQAFVAPIQMESRPGCIYQSHVRLGHTNTNGILAGLRRSKSCASCLARCQSTAHGS